MAKSKAVLVALLVVFLLVVENGAYPQAPKAASAAPVRMPSAAPAATGPAGTWVSPFFQDGQSPGQYTFLSILNTGTASNTVTVSFYRKDGLKITDTSFVIVAGESKQLLTGSGGGVPATTGGDGWIKIQGTGSPDLVPTGYVVFSSGGVFTFAPLPFYTP